MSLFNYVLSILFEQHVWKVLRIAHSEHVHARTQVWEKAVLEEYNANITDDYDDDGGNHEAVVFVSLSYCGLLPSDLDKVWKSLGATSDLTVLE